MAWQDSLHQQSKAGTPPGDILQPSSTLQFAILQHRQSHYTHWDLFLELPQRELLATFRVDQPPETWTIAGILPVQAMPDHRRIYLDYQGPISGDRGTVTRYDRGMIHLLQDFPAHIAGEIIGATLHCRIELTAVAAATGQWNLRVAAL